MFCGDDRKLPHIVYPSLTLCKICKHNVKKIKVSDLLMDVYPSSMFMDKKNSEVKSQAPT